MRHSEIGWFKRNQTRRQNFDRYYPCLTSDSTEAATSRKRLKPFISNGLRNEKAARKSPRNGFCIVDLSEVLRLLKPSVVELGDVSCSERTLPPNHLVTINKE